MTIIVIDGQGGGIGRALTAAIAPILPEGAELLCVGTNAMATAAMLKAGAQRGATGENAVRWAAANADVLVAPIALVLKDSMMVTPVVALCVGGLDAVETVRLMVGATNARKAAPGTIRGDFSMSGEQNVIHASDSIESAQAEIERFFGANEIFEYESAVTAFEYGCDEKAKM